MRTSNWPHGTDLGHPNFTGKTSSKYRYDGQGAYAPNSGRIPFVEASMYVGGTALVIWATLRIAFWIWG